MDSTFFAELALTVATGLAAFIAHAVRTFILTHANRKQVDLLEQLASIAVNAAEQQGSPINELVVDKKQYAMDALEAALKQYGINLDPAVLDAAIEAAVMNEFNYPAKTAPAETVTVQ